jgi:hypothetical protein
MVHGNSNIKKNGDGCCGGVGDHHHHHHHYEFMK